MREVDGQRFARACSLFEELCDLEHAQQERELETAAGEDHALREEVRALLAADRRPTLLDKPALDAVGGWSALEAGAAPARIGEFEILGLIGEGGMGVVYEARQASPRRSVALKLVRPGLVSEERLRRFLAEAEVLARLDHPGIAQVFGAGVAETEAGPRPYIAMELVRGRPIDVFAREEALDIDARVELCARLCDAVQHAHDKGVVHRDLKPANVLVGEEGRVKVLDFGVARILEGDLRSRTTHTAIGEVLGTLPYMSPEQVAGDPARIDARSDVYALGVMIYELLSGVRPLDLGRYGLVEAARVIAEEEPTNLGLLDRRLRGDVETIVAKALAKERERRYGSAAELAGDLRRHLANEPVQARPASRAYQARKFARRHRGLVGGVAVAFGALLAGVVVSTGLFLRSQSNLARAEQAELDSRAAAHRAAGEARLARATTDFLIDIFQVSDPTGAAGESLGALELFERGRARFGARLADQPEARAELGAVLGRVSFNLGQYALARPLLEETIEVLRALPSADPTRLAAALFTLGEVHHYEGDLGRARVLYEEALALRQENLAPGDPEFARTLDVYSRLLRDQRGEGDLERSHELALRAQRLRIDHGAPALDLSESLQSLATLAWHQGEPDGAERLFREALALRAQLVEASARVPELHHALGKLALERGALAEAEAHYRSSLELTREAFGGAHVFVAHNLAGLAAVISLQGSFDQAQALLDEALGILGEGDRAAREGVLLSLAYLFYDRGDLERSAEVHGEVLASYRERLGEDHPYVAVARSNIAVVRLAQRRPLEAEEHLRAALEIFRTRAPLELTHGTALRHLAVALLMQGRASEAAPFAEEAVRRLEQTRGTAGPDRREAVSVLADVYQACGRVDEAAALRGR